MKKLVDVYGSAYGSKKKDALNEAVRLWLEAVEEGSGVLAESRKAHDSIKSKRISPLILDLLGEKETIISAGQERKVIAEALKARLS